MRYAVTVVAAIGWRLRTGALRRDLPGRRGSWKTAHNYDKLAVGYHAMLTFACILIW